MWRTLWRSIDRFSIQHFKYIINELRMIKVVDKVNKELVVDLLQSIVEIVTYGDRHDPAIFECFMEYQVLGEFVRMLKISRNSRIEAPLLQYLSIMIQNMDTDHAIYYCLSNDYINSVITHQYEFDGGDLASYYVSFLRVVSSKLNRDTLCLLVKVHEDAVVSFPLYSEALKFAYHGEKMIQTAVRALTLNIYNVSDDMVYQFITTPPVSQYFSDLVLSIRKQCTHLDALVDATDVSCPLKRTRELLVETDKIVDDLYYLEDILSVEDSYLGKMVTQNLVSLLVFPMLLPLLQLGQSNGTDISAVTSLFVLSRLLQVVQGENMINFVATTILYADTFSTMKDATEGITNGGITQEGSSLFNPLNEMVCPETKGAENFQMNYLLGDLSEHLTCDSYIASFPCDDTLKERGGIHPFIFSDKQSLMLASLMLLLVLAESKGLDYRLAGLIGFRQTKTRMQKTNDSSPSQVCDGGFFVRHLPQILHALLKVLVSEPPLSVQIQWHTGWLLRKLLIFQEKKPYSHDVYLFNMSYQQSCESLRKELKGCWFDYIPDTLRNEWAKCKSVLEESSQSKDPFFVLELACHQPTSCGNTASALAWQSMVDAVKVFVLHLHLKAFIFNGDPYENPLTNLKSSSLAISGRKYVSDLSSASFGSETSLGSGIPCKISFSKVGARDIYMIPVAAGISGKLLLLEKHPLHSKRGVVIAIAPLAGLSPKIDANHPTWLHLQIREFDPSFDESKTRSHCQNTSSDEECGRWTIGFPDAKACDAARFLVLDEINKQRSSVESLLAPLLQDTSENSTNCQEE